MTINENHMTTAQVQAALGIPDATEATPAKVWLVEAEHWSVPGIPMYACTTEERAKARALQLVRVMLDEIKFPHSSDDWQSELERLRQTLHGDQDIPTNELPRVTITEIPCDLGEPEEEAAKAAAMKPTPCVRQLLDLSTCHLKMSTREALDRGGIACAAVYPHPNGYGWFVSVPTPDMVEDYDYQEAGPPDDLRAVFDRARALGCEFVMIDCDAPEDETLPDYQDGEEPD